MDPVDLHPRSHDHRQPSGESKTAATEEQKAKRSEVRDARKVGRECCPRLVLRARPVLFDEILTDYLDYSRRSKRSHRDDRPRAQRLRSTFGKRLASDIRPKDVEDFKAALAEVRTIATVNHHLKLLKAVFNRAIRQGRLTYNPGAAVRLDQEHNARQNLLQAVKREHRLVGIVEVLDMNPRGSKSRLDALRRTLLLSRGSASERYRSLRRGPPGNGTATRPARSGQSQETCSLEQLEFGDHRDQECRRAAE